VECIKESTSANQASCFGALDLPVAYQREHIYLVYEVNIALLKSPFGTSF
jgi:hypothetical protein